MGLAEVQLGDIDLASLLGQLSGSLAQENRCVCFGDEYRADDPQHTCEDSHQALNPSPTLGLTKETTNDRT